MTDINVVVDKIVNIPNDFNSLDKSEYTLVKESGYLDVHDQVSEQVIAEGLKRQPQVIDEWLQLSEDQRVSEGWFLKFEDNFYRVCAFSSKNGYRQNCSDYPDEKSACAAFIKLRIEFIRGLIGVKV